MHLSCFAPVRDGELLPANPWSPEASPLLAGLPLLTGSNHDEMSFFMGDDPEGFALDEAGWTARVREAAGDRADEALALYGRLYPDLSPSQRWIRFHSDRSITVPTMKVARRKAVLDGKVWRYRLDLASPVLDGSLGATHTLETPLIFNQPGAPLIGANPAAATLAGLMSETWVRFADEGKVSTLDLPAYDAENGATLAFDAKSRIEQQADAQVYELLEPLVPG